MFKLQPSIWIIRLAGRRRWTFRGFFRQGNESYRIRSAKRESFAMAFGDVYIFGPTSRAENSTSPAPCGRVWHDRAGEAFANLASICAAPNSMIKFSDSSVMKKCR
jgi:hypothetical protein